MKPSIHLLFLLSLVWHTLLIAQTEYKVYPGDTNEDGIVNVRDLLPIGLAYGQKVNSRADMDIDWAGKLAIDSLGLFLPNTLVNFRDITGWCGARLSAAKIASQQAAWLAYA